MKKILAFISAVTVCFAFAGCSSENAVSDNQSSTSVTESVNTAGGFKPEKEMTIENIIKNTTPSNLVEYMGAFKAETTYDGFSEGEISFKEESSVYVKKGSVINAGMTQVYSDGYTTKMFFTDDPSDRNIYVSNNGVNDVYSVDESEISGMINASLTGYEYSSPEITETKEENGKTVVTVSVKNEGEETCRDVITADSKTGLVEKKVSSYKDKSGNTVTATTIFSYAESFDIDTSMKNSSEDKTGSEDKETSETAGSSENRLSFATTDINGNAYTSDELKNAKLVLANYWEPWCGPCVSEMPELQKLYENYKDKGLVVLGIFHDTDSEEDAKAVVAAKGITYPVIYGNEETAKYSQSYVPSTVFTDGEGNLLSDEPVAGAQSYEEWEALVKSYLGE